jgi:outer membrane protein assembly factor BamE
MKILRDQCRPGWAGLWAVLAIALLLGACATYKMDIQQGNVVTQEMILKLRPGMTRSQVKFIMGTPLVNDPFHTDRSDYFYMFIRRGAVLDKRLITLTFENGQLRSVIGDADADPGLKGEATAAAPTAATPTAKAPTAAAPTAATPTAPPVKQ